MGVGRREGKGEERGGGSREERGEGGKKEEVGVGRRDDDSQFKGTFEIPQREVSQEKWQGRNPFHSTAAKTYVHMYVHHLSIY